MQPNVHPGLVLREIILQFLVGLISTSVPAADLIPAGRTVQSNRAVPGNLYLSRIAINLHTDVLTYSSPLGVGIQEVWWYLAPGTVQLLVFCQDDLAAKG